MKGPSGTIGHFHLFQMPTFVYLRTSEMRTPVETW